MTTKTSPQRRVVRTVTTPEPAPGFAGPGHTAVFAIDPNEFAQQDPFIMMADDRLDLSPGVPVGGEHPHAGFEIATFVLAGAVHDQDEGVLRAGDLQWMTAGRGVIHGEHVMADPGTRILQLWFALPESERWSEPRFGTITREDADVFRTPRVDARVYSFEEPEPRLMVVEARIDAGGRLEQDLPAAFNGFVYVIDGDIDAGVGEVTRLRAGQIGWLDRPETDGASYLTLTGGGPLARVVLYAGAPRRVPILTHGPFVGGSRADLMRMSREYMGGQFQRMSALTRAAKAKSGAD